MNITLETDFPVALDSPDHLHPWGTLQDNAIGSEHYQGEGAKLMLDELYSYFGEQSISIMDLGCSGGQFTIDALNRGWLAVGLEGSDYSIVHHRAAWPEYHNKNLFTCDCSKPFQVLIDGEPAQFDCITTFEFLEHLHPDTLDTLFDNVCKHLTPNGIFCGQYSIGPDSGNPRDKFPLHQTIQGAGWWNKKFSEYFNIVEDYPFKGCLRILYGSSIRYLCKNKK